MKYDNEVIIQQARGLFAYLGNTQGKVQQQHSSYKKYKENKNGKTLQKATEDLRVILLYTEEPSLKKQLEEQENEAVLTEMLKK